LTETVTSNANGGMKNNWV